MSFSTICRVWIRTQRQILVWDTVAGTERTLINQSSFVVWLLWLMNVRDSLYIVRCKLVNLVAGTWCKHCWSVKRVDTLTNHFYFKPSLIAFWLCDGIRRAEFSHVLVSLEVADYFSVQWKLNHLKQLQVGFSDLISHYCASASASMIHHNDGH